MRACWGLVLLLLVSLPVGAHPLHLRLTSAQPQYRLGESLLCTLTITNTALHPVKFTYYRPTFWYPYLTGPDGHKLWVQYPPYNGPAQLVEVELPGGGSRDFAGPSFKLLAESPVDRATQEVYCVATPGSYSAVAEFSVTGTGGQTWKLVSKAVKIKLVGR